MELLKITTNYCATQEGRAAERAVFEAAMQEKIEKDGFRMCDLMFELYRCQKAISCLQQQFDGLNEAKHSKKR